MQYGTAFNIGTSQPDQIAKISLIGLSSVTHSFNTGQRLRFLTFKVTGGALNVDPPPNANSCSPGYYMLFILNKQGVPSVARIIQIAAPAAVRAEHEAFTAKLVAAQHNPPTALKMRAMVRATASGTRIEVGITPTCPYGLSACWGGAFEALRNLDGVEHVDPIPHASSSSASVYLENGGLPDLDRWSSQFQDYVHKAYGLRGFEATLTGVVEARDNAFLLVGDGQRPVVELVPLELEGKIQWDKDAQRPQAIKPEEAAAYSTLVQSVASGSTKLVTVTGPVSQTEAGYKFQVRLVEL